MKKLFTLIAFLLAMTLTPQTYASENIAGQSATLVYDTVRHDIDLSQDVRVKALQNVLEKYNSILVPEAENFVYYADKYGIDWRLLVSIAGLESGYGSQYVHGSYNAYGWGGGYIYFSSWEEGIDSVSRSLRTRYYDRGADTVWKIGPIYAENPHWAQRINGLMGGIDKEYDRLTMLSTLSAPPRF